MRLAPLIITLCMVSIACDSEPKNVRLSNDDLQREAVVELGQVGSSSGDTILSEIVGILPLSPGRALVVNAYAPFLQIYGASGELEGTAANRAGEGPGELQQPWRAARSSDRLWILDSGRLVEWSVDPLMEARDWPGRPGAVALIDGCGRELLSVYATRQRTTSGRYRLGSFALSEFRDSVWVGWSSEMATPFAPVGYGFAAVALDTTVVILNPYERAIEIFGCGGLLLDSIPLNVPSGRPPEARGGARIGERIVFFMEDREAPDDATAVIVFVPGANPADHARIAGSVRLAGVTDSLVWLVTERFGTEVMAIPMSKFLDMLRLESS